MVQKYVVYRKIGKCSRNLFSRKLQALKWRHNHSQSPVFGLAGLHPTGNEISCFWYIKTRGRKIAEHFFAILISTSWIFYQAHKKICNIHLKRFFLRKFLTSVSTCYSCKFLCTSNLKVLLINAFILEYFGYNNKSSHIQWLSFLFLVDTCLEHSCLVQFSYLNTVCFGPLHFPSSFLELQEVLEQARIQDFEMGGELL